jgi:MscS family membrane protein
MLMIRRCLIGLTLMGISALLIVQGAQAAEKATPAATKGAIQVEITYDDPLGRSTPQGTVVGFLKAMQREDYERAVDYLDTRQTGKRAEQLALELN